MRVVYLTLLVKSTTPSALNFTAANLKAPLVKCGSKNETKKLTFLILNTLKSTTMKKITEQEAIELFERIGNLSHITVNLTDKYGIDYTGTVLNNGMVYCPLTNGQRGMSNSKSNAERAMNELNKAKIKKFRVFSGYFDWATDEYEIVNE